MKTEHRDPCGEIKQRLEAFHDGELAPAEQERVAAHVDSCPDCARELASLGAVSTAVRGAFATMPRPVRLTGMETRVKADLEASSGAGTVPRRGFSWRNLGWGGKLGTAGSLAFAVVLCFMIVWNANTGGPAVSTGPILEPTPITSLHMPTVAGPEKIESDGSLLITQSPGSDIEVITVFNVQA